LPVSERPLTVDGAGAGAVVAVGRAAGLAVVVVALRTTGFVVVVVRRTTVVVVGGAVVVVVAAAAAMSVGPSTTTALLPGSAVATTGSVSRVAPAATATGPSAWRVVAVKSAGTSATVTAMLARSQTRRFVRLPLDRSPPSLGSRSDARGGRNRIAT
jgi:hypothetical protein